MSKDRVKAVLNSGVDMASQRQEDAANLPTEAQDESAYCLTDEQVAEVRRRIANPNRRFLTLEQAEERLRSLLGD